MDNNMLFIPKQKKHSYFRTRDVIFLVVVTCIVTLNVSYMIFISSNVDKKYVDEDNSKSLNEFISEYKRIIETYDGELDEDKLINAALEGLIDALPDDYSSVLDHNESNNYDTSLKGEYYGLGVEIVNDTEKGDIYIYKIIEDSPAAKSELKVGDKVISINGKNIEKQPTSVFVDLVQKSKNKKFEIVVEREGKKITTTLSKEKIVLKSVNSEVIKNGDKNVGYMDISIFAANTNKQFKEQLENIEADGIDALIIDLRGNGGGYLSSVTDMLSLFIDKGEVIYQTEHDGKKDKVYSDEAGTKDYKIIVLIDGGSASASEIMAAALSEQCNAILVGKKTYGKGTVQELITLSDGIQYKYTTKKWLTPKGNWVDGKGIKPDYDVALDQNYLKDPSRENDLQFQKALELINE